MKRTSPVVHNRAAKIRPTYVNHHHMNDSLLSPGNSRPIPSGRHSSTLELMSPEINSLSPDGRPHHIRPKHDDGE